MKNIWIDQKLKECITFSCKFLDYDKTGQNLKKLRLALHLSRKDLEKYLPPQASIQIENAYNPYTIDRVYEYLGVLYDRAKEINTKIESKLAVF